jgi:hypothetical protein
MTPERKQHLRSLDASETPHLAEVLDALDESERRRLREVHAAEAERDEALARAEAAETAAATAWKRFEEMREAYKTNSRTYGALASERDMYMHVARDLGLAVAAKRLVTAAELGREHICSSDVGIPDPKAVGTLYALRHAVETGTDAHLSSEAAGLVLGVVRAAMDRAASDVSDGRSDAALLDAVTKFVRRAAWPPLRGDDVLR